MLGTFRVRAPFDFGSRGFDTLRISKIKGQVDGCVTFTFRRHGVRVPVYRGGQGFDTLHARKVGGSSPDTLGKSLVPIVIHHIPDVSQVFNMKQCAFL